MSLTYDLQADGLAVDTNLPKWTARLKSSERIGSAGLAVSGDRLPKKRKMKFKATGAGFSSYAEYDNYFNRLVSFFYGIKEAVFLHLSEEGLKTEIALSSLNPPPKKGHIKSSKYRY